MTIPKENGEATASSKISQTNAIEALNLPKDPRILDVLEQFRRNPESVCQRLGICRLSSDLDAAIARSQRGAELRTQGRPVPQHFVDAIRQACVGTDESFLDR